MYIIAFKIITNFLCLLKNLSALEWELFSLEQFMLD